MGQRCHFISQLIIAVNRLASMLVTSALACSVISGPVWKLSGIHQNLAVRARHVSAVNGGSKPDR